MNPYYPMFVNVKATKCVVVGGGQVALRKVKELLEHGADITVISPDLSIGLKDLADSGEIRVLGRNYREGDLKGCLLAVVATGNQDVNSRVIKEAKKSRVLLNVVDDPILSDFIVPSVVHRGDVLIAVSTGGRSPALARKIRTKLETYFADEYASLALLISAIRTELHNQGVRITGDEWQNAIDPDILIDLLRQGDSAKARTFLLDSLKKSSKLITDGS